MLSNLTVKTRHTLTNRILLYAWLPLYLFAFLISNGQMTPSRSDAYQGSYNIRTGYGTGLGLLYNADGTISNSEDPRFIVPTIHFQLYNGLKLQAGNPTPSNAEQNTLRTLHISGATMYPYFNSQGTDGNGNKIYNWLNWMYPFYDPVYKWPYYTPVGNADTALKYNPWEAEAVSKRNYQEYNRYYYGNNNRFAMSTAIANPTIISNRINQQRDKIVLAFWVGYLALDRQRQNAMMDLRISNLDTQTKLYGRSWFNFPANADVITSSETEYNKIYTTNGFWETKNSLNSGLGEDMAKYNADMDAVLYQATGNYGVNGTTEGATEITNVRSIAYNNDTDPCGTTEKNVDVSIRALTVGGTGGIASPSTNQKFYHPLDPYQLSYKSYFRINITRPSIAFAGKAPCTLGPSIVMPIGTTNGISAISLNITDALSSMIPGTETSTQNAIAIDNSRVRVSLVKKSDYDAAVADGSIATNNDLPVVSGFAYLSQDNFVAIQNTIPQGEYVLKYDYSSPDSKKYIKTEGDQLGEVFAKSIYSPLSVTNPLPVTFGNIKAILRNETVSVYWTTLSEKNNSSFDIEISNDGVKFTTLSTIKSKALNGASNKPLSYDYSFEIGKVAGLLGMPIIALLSVCGFRKRRISILVLSLLTIGFVYSCSKKVDSSLSAKDSKVYIRIAMTNENNSKSYSKIIQAVQE